MAHPPSGPLRRRRDLGEPERPSLDLELLGQGQRRAQLYAGGGAEHQLRAADLGRGLELGADQVFDKSTELEELIEYCDNLARN